jgi:hypothetical protein
MTKNGPQPPIRGQKFRHVDSPERRARENLAISSILAI